MAKKSITVKLSDERAARDAARAGILEQVLKMSALASVGK